MGDVAITIYNEARGEGRDGMRAVKAVIQNREGYRCPKAGCGSNHDLKNWKSTAVFHGYSVTPPSPTAAGDKEAWAYCKELAAGFVSDNTGGATHFQRGAFPSDSYDSTVNPIGSHKFAREKTEITRHRR